MPPLRTFCSSEDSACVTAAVVTFLLQEAKIGCGASPEAFSLKAGTYPGAPSADFNGKAAGSEAMRLRQEFWTGWAQQRNYRCEQCSRCEAVVYCSVECQKSHWKAHKPNCREKIAHNAQRATR